MYIEPEKEIVLILAEASAAPAIIQQIKSDLELEKPGNGILFVQEVLETFGIC